MFNHTGRLKSFYLFTVIMLITPVLVSSFDGCKWSNEDCEHDEDCCSGSCSQLHEGNNFRCESSPIHYPCFFSYQCEGVLLCGEHYVCCAAYWGVCKYTNDCCNSSLVCREEEGFIYKRCLTPSFSPQVLTNNNYLLIVIVFHISFDFYFRFA